MKRYLVAGVKPWNKRHFDEKLKGLPGEWRYLDDPQTLTLAEIDFFQPRYVFFMHWSWKVPVELLTRYECVCFHMTDVPYGRGGSPLQNLIVRGHAETRLTALRMSEQFDAGPVYLKNELELSGTAEEIYVRASAMSAEMIAEIVATEPQPKPQVGDSVNFKRRTPEQSKISGTDSLEKLHDHIRMLDAEGYPKAYLEFDGFRFEFSRSALYDGRIVADVTVTLQKKETSK